MDDVARRSRLSLLRSRLGPGLLFAAAAVGTSHLVQSTRAGAAFGLTLTGLILLACLLKYPLFRFAAEYAAITGESLVTGYARRGRWLVWTVFVAAAIEAVAATAGVSLVTASLARWLFAIDIGDAVGALLLLALTAPLVILGRYGVIESASTVIVIGFSLLTVMATIAGLTHLDPGQTPLFAPFPLTPANRTFAVAVAGWMPIGNIASIMLASWVLAKRARQPVVEGADPVADTRFDFHVGYVTSAALAVCFLLMGAAVIHGHEGAMPTASGEFVAAFVSLYGRTVGAWSTVLVAAAALGVMYSTLMAIMDGFPRLLGAFVHELRRAPAPEVTRRETLVSMAVVLAASCAILFLFLDVFTAFIDVVTIIGFLVAPVVAVANQLAIRGPNVPPARRPGRVLVAWNTIAAIVFTLTMVAFLLGR